MQFFKSINVRFIKATELEDSVEKVKSVYFSCGGQGADFMSKFQDYLKLEKNIEHLKLKLRVLPFMYEAGYLEEEITDMLSRTE